LAIYKEIEHLGEGGYGSVKLCKNRVTKQLVAIKFIKISSIESTENINSVYNEINAMREL